MKHTFIPVALAAFTLLSCGGKSDCFNISGRIDGAEGASVVLENSINGRWVAIDSGRTDGNGAFNISHKAPGYPQVFRLTVGDGQSVYFPVDSLDRITLNAKAETFATDYSLTGTSAAETMADIDHKARKIASAAPGDAAKMRDELKSELSRKIVADPASVIADYILNKEVGGELLYSPADAADLRIIGAVANAFSTSRPNDPRTARLVEMFISGKKSQLAASNKLGADTVYVSEAKLLEISLPDEKGNMQSLSKVTGKGNVVILNFTTYEFKESPVFNKILSDVYKANKRRGLEIFQVGFDASLPAWKSAASNLPWITVYDEKGVASPRLSSYNVQSIPAIYLIDRNGEIACRIDNLDNLQKELDKLL